MIRQKLIVVLGATGNQGGSVIDTFLKVDPSWRVRGITRNKFSVKAQSLAARGVEIVEADMAKPTTLTAAFADASIIFAVTDFMGIYFDATAGPTGIEEARNVWAAEQETQQLRNVIDEAAKISTLERFVMSSLSNAPKWSQEEFNHIYHFNGKANAEEYGRQQHPELWSKTSIFQAGIFLDIYKTKEYRPRRTQSGQIQFTCPWNLDMKLPWIAANEDPGPLVHALVLDEPGKTLLGYREWATLLEVVAAFTRITGLQAEIKTMPVEEWIATPSPDLVLEFTEFFQYWEEFGFEAQKDPPVMHPHQMQTAVHLMGIEDWLARQDWSEIIEME